MSDPCEGKLPPEVMAGLQHFNAGEYFEAHEDLETAWKAETGPIRELYQGILQAAVVYLHIRRGNHAGALKVYVRSRKWLDRWPAACLGIDVGQLRRDLQAAVDEVRRLGSERMDEFDPGLLKPIHWK